MGSKLDVKKWLYATALVFIFMTIFEFLLRRLIFIPWHPELGPPAEQPENIWMLRLWIYLGRVFFSLFFVYIYTRGYEGKKGMGEGLRFGLWVGLMVQVPLFFSSVATSGWQTEFLFARPLAGLVEIILAGILVAMAYKAQPKAA